MSIHAPSLPRTQSLRRAVDILRKLGEHGEPMTAAGVARAIGLPRPTVSRLLATLADAGLVDRVPDGGGWVLGHEIVRLGRAADPARNVAMRAYPALEALAQRLEETVMLAIPRPPVDIDVVSQVDAPNLLGVTGWVGRTVPAHASSGAKLLLADLPDDVVEGLMRNRSFAPLTSKTITDLPAFTAELERVRRLGYAETVDEMEEGLTGVSVPVRRPDGSIGLLIGVYGPTFRLHPQRRAEVVSALLECADELRPLAG